MYTENIAYAQAGFFCWPITLKLVWFFESHKRTLGCDYYNNLYFRLNMSIVITKSIDHIIFEPILFIFLQKLHVTTPQKPTWLFIKILHNIALNKNAR